MRALATVALLFSLVSARVAQAQLGPTRGPSSEQQEIATVLLLAPEASVLGAFLVGGGTFLTTRQCCTPQHDSDDVDPVPVAIGAGVGAAIGATWAVLSISDKFHPGSKRNAVIGGVVGAGIATGVFFGGPENEKNSDEVLRLVTFLFLPAMSAYAGFHLDPGSGGYYSQMPAPVWQKHVGPERELSGPMVQRFSIRF